ncbi:MAG: cytochrome C biogenesis protein, partial [Gammaproteobacteria bacterium]
KPVEVLGLAIFPLTAVAMALDLHNPGHHLLGNEVSWSLRVHVTVSILAYAMLTLATVQALLLALQDNHLRSHHPGGFIRALPPLQTMESLLFEMIGLGFVLLTLSLLSGFLYLEDMFAQHVVHKTLLSIIAWVVFGALLWGRWRFGWRGTTAIRWTLTGFVVLMLAYFGSKAVLELILQR